MRAQRAVVGFVVAVAVAACGSSSTAPNGGGGTGGHSTTIAMSSTTSGGAYGSGGNYYFSPTPDTVPAGSVVTFTIGTVTHNVVFDTGPSPLPTDIPASTNTSIQRTFVTAGTYNFHCSIHNFAGVLIAQ